MKPAWYKARQRAISPAQKRAEHREAEALRRAASLAASEQREAAAAKAEAPTAPQPTHFGQDWRPEKQEIFYVGCKRHFWTLYSVYKTLLDTV